jgi:hypothetical protein
MSPGALLQLRPETLTTDLDALAHLRARLKTDQEQERELTARVLAGLDQLGVTSLRTAATLARIDHVTRLSVDPGLFIMAVGPDQAPSALTVSVERARALLDGDTLRAISQATESRRLVVSSR